MFQVEKEAEKDEEKQGEEKYENSNYMRRE